MSQLIRIPDYCNDGKEIEQSDLENLRNFIADKSITDLVKENSGLLVFPNSLADTKDGIEEDNKEICSIKRDSKSEKEFLITYDILGFVGCKSDVRDNDEHKNSDTELTIYSRFTLEDKDDFFLHYMVQKVLNINLFDLKHSTSQDQVFDFLLCLFPKYLKEALKQGLYKQYVVSKYNDSNVRGMIDVARHIKMNIPFVGKITYNVREYSYDNNITQLIRHTIEYIRSSKMSKILKCDEDTISFVSQICEATPSYKSQDRNKIISKNLKAPTSPYYLGYIPLQKLCIQILTHKKLKYGNDDNDKKIYGLLFVGSWLWEEYINTILKPDFIHPENRTGKHCNYLFNDGNKDFQEIYPDFIRYKPTCVVGDTKYIPLDKQKEYKGYKNEERATNIYYKTVMYMYRFSSTCGMLLFPHEEVMYDESYKIKDTLGKLWKIGMAIPLNAETFEEFEKEIEESEKKFKEKIHQIMSENKSRLIWDPPLSQN